MIKNVLRLLSMIFIAVMVINLPGCGGGTSGTGVGSQTYAGRILGTDGEPIADATVTIKETGDSSATDQDGYFSVTAEDARASTTLLVETPRSSTEIVISGVASDDTEDLTIAIGEQAATQTSSVTDIRVKLVGTCDSYFENTRPIRQGSTVPKGGVECTLKVSLRSNRGGLPARTFAVQKTNCSQSAGWKTVAEGETGNNGIAQIPFSYKDSSDSCLYRVLVPLNDSTLKPLSFEIWSLSYQNFTSR